MGAKYSQNGNFLQAWFVEFIRFEFMRFELKAPECEQTGQELTRFCSDLTDWAQLLKHFWIIYYFMHGGKMQGEIQDKMGTCYTWFVEFISTCIEID